MQHSNQKIIKKTPYVFKAARGLHAELVAQISEQKNEPGWMTDLRLDALKIFERLPMPSWGPRLDGLSLQDLCYYLKPLAEQKSSWNQVPDDIRTAFECAGIPQGEQCWLAGVGAQYESEVIYKSLKKQWAERGVIFVDMSTALAEYPELFKQYFASVVPAHDNKFAALNTAAWSGGSFIYVPRGVVIDQPLQAYFRLNEQGMGQFERTLIIVEEGSDVHYIEGCSALQHAQASLHSAVVELIVRDSARLRYTTIQNWSTNVYNLVTKRAVAYRNACVAWVDGNFGGKVTMKYPSVILKESGAQAQLVSLSAAGAGQHHDSGGKMIHEASHTSSSIISKSISKDGGCSTYRGMVSVHESAEQVKAMTTCDALILDSLSRADAYPMLDVRTTTSSVGHEASISSINEVQVFYLMSRGVQKGAARALVVNGFMEPFVRHVPMEYAVEIARLIGLDMEGQE